MARSLKKGPFVDKSLMNKIKKLNEANKKAPIAVGAENKNIKVNPSICNNTQKYSSGRKMV